MIVIRGYKKGLALRRIYTPQSEPYAYEAYSDYFAGAPKSLIKFIGIDYADTTRF
jgi:hypothetical protein